ncbi:hypothetical protein F153LOC_01915 [Lelliottia sp. F153]|uniref:DUF3828 domain-containing protein n=1 Tax=unclassified Lelliottia TaxID=2642424 RepID=UPI000C7F1EBB|nr:MULTISPECIES: DUF3828 domain-containing protein [unclassified Lelliottia]PLY48126.1 hypothetical protein F159LOC_02885 [Lelliottia sp. F159]PLY52603.1 hypothetical protein F154LOC_02885 [Lelliottia sp. F154]PLY55778.1 hypothetical protein F153LOC_01915 [Lelliottia sp. F153]
MKKNFIFLVLFPSLAIASFPPSEAESASLQFNKWYVSQLLRNKEPLHNYVGLKRYVTARTIKSLKALYSADPNEADIPDADMFIKSQDFDEDWQQVTVVASDFDAVCTQVYVTFGFNKKHTVIDCMVQEGGVWKVQSVAENVTLNM